MTRLALGLLLLTGCPTPGEPDAGTDAGVEVDGGVDGGMDGGAVESWLLQCTSCPAYGVVGEALAVEFAFPRGDYTVTAVARSPAGEEQALSVVLVRYGGPSGETGKGAKLSLTPSSPGMWTVIVTRSDSTIGGTWQVNVFELARTGTVVTQTFIDPMDTCVRGPQRTSGGLTVCERDDRKTWVYSSDGTLLTSFVGVTARALRSELWTVVNAEVEHRTDVGGSLRFDGAITIDLNGSVTEVGSGKYVRSNQTGMEVVEWDGGTLSLQRISGIPGAEVREADGGVWSRSGCLLRAGCQSMLCSPFVTCPLVTQPVLTLVAPEALWGIGTDAEGHVQVRMRRRPLELEDGTVRTFPVPGGQVGFGLSPAASAFDTGRHVFVARRNGGEIEFSGAVPHSGRVLSASPDWMISLGSDSSSLVFTPLP